MTYETFESAAVLYRFVLLAPIFAFCVAGSVLQRLKFARLRRDKKDYQDYTDAEAGAVAWKWIFTLAAGATVIVALCTFPIAVRNLREILEILA